MVEADEVQSSVHEEISLGQLRERTAGLDQQEYAFILKFEQVGDVPRSGSTCYSALDSAKKETLL